MNQDNQDNKEDPMEDALNKASQIMHDLELFRLSEIEKLQYIISSLNLYYHLEQKYKTRKQCLRIGKNKN